MNLKRWRFCKRMEGAAWKGSGGTWIALRKLRSIQATLADPDDRHVVAAAIHSGTSLIVTFNLKDFPAEVLKPYNLAAQHPDDFIVDLLDLHPTSVLEAVANHRRSLKAPPKTADEYLDTLLVQGLTQSVAIMRQWTVAM